MIFNTEPLYWKSSAITAWPTSFYSFVFLNYFSRSSIWPFLLCNHLNSLIYLTFPVLCISESCIEIKINLNFYFHTSLWCRNSFYEGPKGLHKTFWGTTRKCENKNLSYFFFLFGIGTLRVKFFNNKLKVEVFHKLENVTLNKHKHHIASQTKTVEYTTVLLM